MGSSGGGQFGQEGSRWGLARCPSNSSSGPILHAGVWRVDDCQTLLISGAADVLEEPLCRLIVGLDRRRTAAQPSCTCHGEAFAHQPLGSTHRVCHHELMMPRAAFTGLPLPAAA